MTHKTLIAAFLAAPLLAAAPAQAALMQAVYTGVITTGSDTADYFGLGGALAGQAYVQTFVFDTEAGTLNVFPEGNTRVGGSALSTSPVLTQALLTINNRVLAFDTSATGVVARGKVGSAFQAVIGVDIEENTATAYSYSYMNAVIGTTSLPLALDASFTAVNDAGLASRFAQEAFDSGFNLVESISGSMVASRVVYSAYVASEPVTPAPVPVPAAGLLLLGGMGALALMRRRKQA